MVYLALDTCVWIKLLGIKLTSDHSELDELLYWIERKEITNITTENLIREWNRQKVKQFEIILDTYKSLVGSTGISDTASPLQEEDHLRNLLNNRVQRIDALLTTQSEIAEENDGIILDSWKRCANELAPNHSKDSFRDTVNILSLLHFLKQKQIAGCLFATNNHKDFSAEDNKLKCHPHLEPQFATVGMEYVYFESRASNFKLFQFYLRRTLSDFTSYLAEKRKKELEANQQGNRASSFAVGIPEEEYLDNVQLIDSILSIRNPSGFHKQIVEELIKSHDSYKLYFLRKAGENGLV